MAESLFFAKAKMCPTEIVKLFIEKLNTFDKKELINAAGGKQDNITALLLKEYLWRKNNEKSVKNLKKELTKMEALLLREGIHLLE